MRLLFSIFILLLMQISSKGQPTRKASDLFITDVFMNLREIGLTDKEKKELVKSFRIKDKEIETTLDLDTVENSISIQSCFFESMTMPCDNWNLRSFKVDSYRYKIIYSHTSFSYADKHQNALEVFNYDSKTKAFAKDPIEYAAFNLSLRVFFKKDTPDSILGKYVDNVNPIYAFEGVRIYCTISDTGYSNTLLSEPYLRTYRIEIEWTGKTFSIKSYKPESD